MSSLHFKKRAVVIAVVSVFGMGSHPALLLAQSPFSFNFGSAGSTTASVANQTCGTSAGTGGGMGGGMGGGTCDGTPFLQEVTTVGGQEYYHVVVGTKTGDFGIEYFLRTDRTDCWFGCANANQGGGGMGGGATGNAPKSSSSGTGGTGGNGTNPLGTAENGTGNPTKAAIYMYNKSTEMTQEFLKATETNKPKITQSLTTADTTVQFAIDMSTLGYSSNAQSGAVSLTQTIAGNTPTNIQTVPRTNAPILSSASFDINKLAAIAATLGPGATTPTLDVTGGRYTYTAGGGDGGSLGSYSYFADSFNVYAVNWKQYCDPAQNTASNCTNYGGGSQGMMGGMAGGGGGGGGGM